MALVQVTDEGVRIVKRGCVKTDEEIVAWADDVPLPLTITIDAPTVVPNETGMRPCEALLQRMFSRQNAGPYPANRRLLWKNGGVPRGEAICRAFQARGATECLPPARHNGTAVFEVFPAPVPSPRAR